MHPTFATGVPLQKIMPEWIPGRLFWAYLAGAVLIASGACLVANKKTREAATYLGVMILLLVLFEYLPMLIASPKDIVSLNYFFDTLFFSGAVLLLADACGERSFGSLLIPLVVVGAAMIYATAFGPTCRL